MQSYRLEVRNGDTVLSYGTAWCLRHSIVITAFHVVGKQEHWLHEVFPGTQYLLLNSLDDPVPLWPRNCSIASDVAVLTLDVPLLTAEQLELAQQAPERDARWFAPSYASLANGRAITLSGNVVEGNISPSSSFIQLLIDQHTDVDWEGASGSPILVGGKVVGLLSHGSEGAHTVWATPVAAIISLIDPVPLPVTDGSLPHPPNLSQQSISQILEVPSISPQIPNVHFAETISAPPLMPAEQQRQTAIVSMSIHSSAAQKTEVKSSAIPTSIAPISATEVISYNQSSPYPIPRSRRRPLMILMLFCISLVLISITYYLLKVGSRPVPKVIVTFQFNDSNGDHIPGGQLMLVTGCGIQNPREVATDDYGRVQLTLPRDCIGQFISFNDEGFLHELGILPSIRITAESQQQSIFCAIRPGHSDVDCH